MATGQHRGLLRQLDSLLVFGTDADLTDGQLLERFATREGTAAEQAFATLVERHGPMVLRVCRGVLANSHDTEDAFQATFLVLVKKARALWVSDSLGPWLHQVALRTACCARAASVRRRKQEQAAASQKREFLSVTQDEPGLAQILHEEINRLPDRYRVPLILCDLEGRTHEQAARHLGWPAGTVKSRLSRARQRLRDRLARRGPDASAGAMAAFLRPAGLDNLLPRSLASSTTSNAMRFAASRSILGGSAAVLAQGVLSAMSMTRWWKLASLLIVAGATVSGAGLLARGGAPGAGFQVQKIAGVGTGSSIPVAAASLGKLKITVVERGSLEVERSTRMVNQVESQTRIISLLPDGVKVKQGELVAELDSTMLRNQLINQKIAVRMAEIAFHNARLARETAELAVTEFENGIYLVDRATILGEIKLAESASQDARARLERTRRARQKLADMIGRKEALATPGDVLAELEVEDRLEASQRDILRETFALEKAQSKLNVLQQHTKAKVLKELRIEVEKARSEEMLREQRWQEERGRHDRLESQIKNCKLYAPVDGLLVRDIPEQAWNDEPPGAERVIVREGQRIFWVFDPTGHVMVHVKVPESMVDQVMPGQKARIEVDAFPGQKLDGVVVRVAGLPDAPVGPRGTASPKVYSTLIRVDRSFESFRPGMTARAEILISERDQVLSVPTQAVLSYDGHEHLAVQKPGGGFEWREVTLGQASNTLVEVKQGLKPGEQIALKPIELMSEQEKGQKFGNPPRPTPPAAPKQ